MHFSVKWLHALTWNHSVYPFKLTIYPHMSVFIGSFVSTRLVPSVPLSTRRGPYIYICIHIYIYIFK